MNTTSLPLQSYRLVAAGSGGLVARRAQRVLVIPALTADTRRQAEQLLHVCLDDHVFEGSVLLRKVAYLLTDPAAAAMPGFCLIVSAADQPVHLMVHGQVQVDLPSEATTLSAAGHLTWIEHRVVDPSGLRVTAAGAAGQPIDFDQPWLDLRDGVVMGSAAALKASPRGRDSITRPNQLPVELPHRPATIAASPIEEAAPAPVPSRPALAADEAPIAPSSLPAGRGNLTTRMHAVQVAPTFEAVLLGGGPSERRLDPLPMSDDADEDATQVLVDGIVCSRGHFNDPGAVYCSVCGISMVQRTHEYVSGRRPPLGVLLFDDGSAFTIDGDYVLGREPEFDPAVANGSARPLTLSDPDNAVSRVHAELRLEGWHVFLEDRGSSNGTLVSRSGADDWQQLAPGCRVELTSGQHIRFGDRGAVYESHVRGR